VSQEPTSAHTLGDLMARVALKLGIADYGPDGTSPPGPPTDAHDLSETRRVVNDALRMFFADAPTHGWRWTRATKTLTIWPDLLEDPSRTVTGGVFDSGTNSTPITVDTTDLVESMEDHTISIDGVGDFTIDSVSSSTEAIVKGDASGASGAQYSILVGSGYTMPRDFQGQLTGSIVLGEGTNRGITAPSLVAEDHIRRLRVNDPETTGVPQALALRKRQTSSIRRLWEFMVWPDPDQRYTVEVSFLREFDKLVETTDSPPTPVIMDDAILAAVIAVAERRFNDAPGEADAYYRQIALPAAYRADGRSGPRALGTMTDPRHFRAEDVHPFEDPVNHFRRVIGFPPVTFLP